MGHEASGVINALGPDVQGWAVGDRVTFGCVIHCTHCYHCRRGQPQLCDGRRWLGVSIPGVRKDGAFAEYVAVPQQILFGVPDGVSFERAAMMEPLTIAAHAVARTPLDLYDSAVVVGAGMIGLLVIQLLKAAGCGQVIAVDVNPARLALAERFGATVLLRPDLDDVPAAVARLCAGRGADVAFEAVGTGATVNLALTSLRKGGSLTLIGNLAQRVDLPLQEMVIRELTLRGTTNAAHEWDACLQMLARGVVEVDPLISMIAPLREGVGWFDRLLKGDPGLMKVILKP